MNKPIKDYDCVAEVRKIRDELDALYRNDPAAFIEILEKDPVEYFNSLRDDD